MGREQDLILAVKNGDVTGVQKLVAKVKAAKTSEYLAWVLGGGRLPWLQTRGRRTVLLGLVVSSPCEKLERGHVSFLKSEGPFIRVCCPRTCLPAGGFPVRSFAPRGFWLSALGTMSPPVCLWVLL